MPLQAQLIAGEGRKVEKSLECSGTARLLPRDLGRSRGGSVGEQGQPGHPGTGPTGSAVPSTACALQSTGVGRHWLCLRAALSTWSRGLLAAQTHPELCQAPRLHAGLCARPEGWWLQLPGPSLETLETALS